MGSTAPSLKPWMRSWSSLESTETTSSLLAILRSSIHRGRARTTDRLSREATNNFRCRASTHTQQSLGPLACLPRRRAGRQTPGKSALSLVVSRGEGKEERGGLKKVRPAQLAKHASRLIAEVSQKLSLLRHITEGRGAFELPTRISSRKARSLGQDGRLVTQHAVLSRNLP